MVKGFSFQSPNECMNECLTAHILNKWWLRPKRLTAKCDEEVFLSGKLEAQVKHRSPMGATFDQVEAAPNPAGHHIPWAAKSNPSGHTMPYPIPKATPSSKYFFLDPLLFSWCWKKQEVLLMLTEVKTTNWREIRHGDTQTQTCHRNVHQWHNCDTTLVVQIGNCRHSTQL